MEKLPKFIPTKAEGNDLCDGHSQNSIAKAIGKHMLSVDSNVDNKLPRIIGVEGEWGCGKSNVIECLDKHTLPELTNTKHDQKDVPYFFFTYDAWGHQEDLQRRSILELLTKKLIDDNILTGLTTMMVFDDKVNKEPELKKCTWTEKLNSLIAKKSYTKTISRPSVYNSTKWFVLALFFTGIIPTALGALHVIGSPILGGICWPYGLLIILSPIIIFMFFMQVSVCNKRSSWHEMWSMYNTSAQDNTTSYTISELEPSVKEFQEWMHDISNGLPDNKKLVIVFDNMDRLPSKKVKTLWSSIHTFFAGNDYRNIWCIIPYDKAHLAKVYGENHNKYETTTQFINKTFSIVFRIPAPVTTDYKGLFNKLWQLAFSECKEIDNSDCDIVNRMYRKTHKEPNARQIITFINKLVSLINIWEDKISIKAMALFAINQDDILKNPEDEILSGTYLKNLEAFFTDDEHLKTEISSMAYVVSFGLSSQIPLKKYLRKCLSDGNCANIVEYSNKNLSFYTILNEEIVETDHENVDSAVKCLVTLQDSKIKDKQNQLVVSNCWNILADAYKPNIEGEKTFRQTIKDLMQNADKSRATKVGQSFINSFISGKEPHEGDTYFTVYKEFTDFTTKNNIKILNIPEVILDPPHFLKYLEYAKEDYFNYPISCPNENLVNSCNEWLNNGSEYIFALNLLKKDKDYDLTTHLKYAERIVHDNKITKANIDNTIAAINILETSYPEFDDISITNLKNIYSTLDEKINKSKSNIQTILILHGEEYDALDDTKAKSVYTTMIEYYADSQDLINACQNYNTNSLNSLLAFCINNNLHSEVINNTPLIVNNLNKIRVQTICDYQKIIEFFDNCGYKSLSENNTQVHIDTQLIEPNWYSACVNSKCNLADAIIKQFYNDISALGINLMRSNTLVPSNNFWCNTLNIVIDHKLFSNLPDNIKQLAVGTVVAIGKDDITTSNFSSLIKKLLKRISFDDISGEMNTILINLCNKTYSMNAFKFQKLHKFLEEALSQAQAQTVTYLNQCLDGIINDPECQTIIANNKEYYKPLIENNINNASILKQKLLNIKKTDDYQNKDFKAFVDSLDIEETQEGEKNNTTS